MAVFNYLFNDLAGTWKYLIRLAAAAVIGALIGTERTRRQKSAGIRTHVVVAVGAALMMIVSKYGFFDVIAYDSINLDASRIASQIVTGVGFLGAGIIFLKNDSVRGLTTAAGVWATAGVGMAVGAGLYAVSVAATALIIIIHLNIRQTGVSENLATDTLMLTIYDEEGALDKLKEELVRMQVQVGKCHVSKRKSGTISLRFYLKHSTEVDWTEILDLIGKNSYVKSVGV